MREAEAGGARAGAGRGPGRPRGFDAEEALGAILAVFWAKGFEGASMADLVAATGLAKGSLYAAFGDKRAMYLKALALYDRRWIEAGVALLGGEGDPRGRIAAFFDHGIASVTAGPEPRGCFVCHASVDQAGRDPETARIVRASLAALRAGLARAVGALADAAAATGRPRDRGAEARVAALLEAAYFGIIVLGRGGAGVAVLDDAKAAALAALDPLAAPGAPGAPA